MDPSTFQAPRDFRVQPIPHPARRLHLLGTFTQLALALNLIIDLVRASQEWSRRSLVVRAIADPGSVSRADLHSADLTVSHLARIGLALLVLTGILFLTWFYRARKNAEVFNAEVLRYGTGWAIGAWFTPVLGLWRPYQMVTDVLNASELPPRRVWERRQYAVIQLWWWIWIASNIAGRVVAAMSSNTPAEFESKALFEIGLDAASAIAAILAIIVVGRLTRANDRRRDIPTPAVPVSPPPGWYPDPQGIAGLRWFDGTSWTGHTNP